MTDKVRVEVTLDGQLYSTTCAFSKDLNFTKKQMLLRSLKSLMDQLDKELPNEENKND